MSATSDQVLDRLKTDFEAAFVASQGGDGSVNTVYKYRTNPGNKTAVAISLSYQGRAYDNAIRTAGGNVPTFKIIAAIGVNMDTDEKGGISEDELAAADLTLNTVEDRIYALLDKRGGSDRNDLWSSVHFPEDSARPPQFADMPNVRIGLIPFRLQII